jgi:hypothetical protein
MVAFDQMRLKIKDLEWVHKLLPVFEEVSMMELQILGLRISGILIQILNKMEKIKREIM